MAGYTRAQLIALARADARKFGVDPNIFVRQINQESGFRTRNVTSSAGAQGIAQFMPSTAAGYHIDPNNPVQALLAAAKMDAGNLRKYGSYQRMLSAYNSGRADAYLDPKFAGGQTYNYVRSIMGGRNPSVGAAPKAATPGSAPATPSGAMGADALRSMAASYLLSESASEAKGGMPDFGGLMALATARQQLGAAQQVYGPKPGGGAQPVASGMPTVGGRVKFTGASLQGVKQPFLARLDAAAHAAGATTIDVISGYRSPSHNAAVGGAAHSNHTTGNALDGRAYVPGKGWVPLGTLLRGSAGKFGLRSGDVPGFFNGGPDPNHVDDGFNQH